MKRRSFQSWDLEAEVRFAKAVFLIAGVWGLAVLTPMYFLFDFVGRQYPPAITHPDFYYGFIGVGLVWQVAFLVIGGDPFRLRPMMIPAMLEKFIFVISLVVLYAHGKLVASQLAVVAPDLTLGLLFVSAFLKTPARGLIQREMN
jgi:hypothetical protein